MNLLPPGNLVNAAVNSRTLNLRSGRHRIGRVLLSVRTAYEIPTAAKQCGAAMKAITIKRTVKSESTMKTSRCRFLHFLLTALILTGQVVWAEVKPNALFSDDAVLQQR